MRQNDLTGAVTEVEGTNVGRAKVLLVLEENAEIRGLDVARKVVKSCFDNFMFSSSTSEFSVKHNSTN